MWTTTEQMHHYLYNDTVSSRYMVHIVTITHEIWSIDGVISVARMSVFDWRLFLAQRPFKVDR